MADVTVTATSPIRGVDPGDTLVVDENYAAWLAQNGYIEQPADPKEDTYGHEATSVMADLDPTLAENREDPGETFEYEGASPTWTATTAYTDDSRVALSGGEVLDVTINEDGTYGGTSGATEPAAPAEIGDTVTDNEVTWVRRY